MVMLMNPECILSAYLEREEEGMLTLLTSWIGGTASLFVFGHACLHDASCSVALCRQPAYT
eukprot:scaffold47476_cov12-Tisochrysis_lutea.AAC.1